MGTGLSIVRALVLALGVLLFLGGVLVAASGGAGAFAGGFWLLVTGGVLIIAVAIERTRYRSLQAEHSGEPPGPGGGETRDAPLERGFQRTDEIFEDPTTRRHMRVWVNGSTGERRYRAED
jgi:hypothetical protein